MATRRLAAGLLQHSLGHQTASIFVKNTGVRHLFVSRAVAAVHAIEVPVMGESITEGTLDVILKQPGDAVQQDEVICTIATDKVAVDVRSPVSGVLKSFAAEEDQEVEVGSILAHVDTDGEVSSNTAKSEAAAADEGKQASTPETKPAPKAAQEKPPAATQSSATSSPSSSAHGRRPMIQFRHGRANQEAAAGGAAAASTAAAPAEGSFDYDAAFPSKADKSYLDLPPMYGRPPISAAEAEAIDMGGIM